MAGLRVTLNTFSEVLDADSRTPFFIACVLNLHAHDEVIGVRILEKGQDVLGLLHELDAPSATLAVVGLQIAIPPSMTKTNHWELEAILEFQAATIAHQDDELSGYAYRTLSGRLFSDECELRVSQLVNARTIYAASNAIGPDIELSKFQMWLSAVLEELVNEAYALKIDRNTTK
ncbi:hypothetical protein [Pseudomonas sp. BP01]|uniref:hypothetical protein n=1 Tax=Pseudomonas sp. BP01 TaxID=2976152 RepID=UPI001FAA455E|nr:hypothetical protein [Pseudomonas sp. BP01]